MKCCFFNEKGGHRYHLKSVQCYFDIMDYLNRPNRYKMPPFETCVKTAFKEPVVLLPVMESYPFFQSHKGGHHYHFQPPPFIVGGFVGSKICEHKNGSANYSDLLGRIISILTTLKPDSSRLIRNQSHFPFHSAWPRNSSDMLPKSSRSYAEVTITSPPVAIPSVQKVISPVIEVVSPKKASTLPTPHLPAQDSVVTNMSPVCQRTVSESSDTSWASSDSRDPIANLLPQSSNPWLNNIIVCVSGSVTADDDDSDWDCVDDYQSENGEIISDFQWQHGDCLSPISSPVSRTPPAANIPDGYDIDEDDDEGVLISCNPYAFDEEEEAREQRAADERIRAANQRWEQQGLTDEPDGEIVRKSTHGKQVQFASKLVHVRPMITWSHAYRSARKSDWERLARDTDRFRDRIEAVSTVISPILDPFHRDRIRRRIDSSAPQ